MKPGSLRIRARTAQHDSNPNGKYPLINKRLPCWADVEVVMVDSTGQEVVLPVMEVRFQTGGNINPAAPLLVSIDLLVDSLDIDCGLKVAS